MDNYKGIRFFHPSEFDSPDQPGSGIQMKRPTLLKLDHARKLAGIPFFVTSGFRTREYNQDLIKRGYKASPTSSHMKGRAADIAVNDSTRDAVLASLSNAGFKRFGIGKTFIHVDDDPEKFPAVWYYNGLTSKDHAPIPTASRPLWWLSFLIVPLLLLYR